MGLHEKKTTHYKEQDSEKIKTYQEQIKGIHPENIAYIDETWIETYLISRIWLCSKRPENIRQNQWKKSKRIGIVAAKIGEKIVAPMEYGVAMDSLLFETWFERKFLPVIKKGTVIVMDKAPFHRKKTA